MREISTFENMLECGKCRNLPPPIMPLFKSNYIIVNTYRLG